MRSSLLLLAVVLLALVGSYVIGSAQIADSVSSISDSAAQGKGLLAGARLSDKETISLIWWVFCFSILMLAAFWAFTITIFGSKNELALVADLTKSGLVLKLVTVVAIVAIIFILGLVGRVESNQVTTVLASIAGYVLGESAATARRLTSGDGEAPAPNPVTPPAN
jgi:hypothetical protein